MTPDVEAFLREIEMLSEFRAAVARDPKVAADFEAMEGGLRAVYRVGADDAGMIELFDALRRTVARDELTIKRRLAAIQAILARALVRAAQRIEAAFLAISLRSLADSFLARVLPPLRPPRRASADTSDFVSSISPVAILAIMTARAFTSAGRFSPLGPLGIVSAYSRRSSPAVLRRSLSSEVGCRLI
jgi:hypothetical protein